MYVYFSLIFVVIQTIWSTNASLNNRLDCFLEVDFKVEQKSCEERGCIWDSEKRAEGIPICYLDTNKVGYKRVNEVKTETGIEINLQMKDTAKSTFKTQKQIENLKFEVIYLTERILRFKVLDSKNPRYEVPFQKNFPLLQKPVHKTDENDRTYSFELSESKDDFRFSIVRKSTKTKLFDTSIGGLLYSDQFLQIATKVATKNIYGMGENSRHSLNHDMDHYQTFPLFSHDQVITGKEQMNEYGVHPFYTCLENDGKSHGILLLNSNAMEYTVLPEPGLSFKTTGGILDFFVIVGENPEHVIQLYTSLIGRPFLPPFWGLGFQLTRWGYKDTNEVENVINRNIKAQVPLDVMYMDIDYMDKYHDFSYNHNNFAKLPQLINETKVKHNLHWTLILDPAIEALNDANPPFTDGYQKEVFIKWDKSVPKDQRWNPPNVPTDKDVFYGHVWPKGPAGFPDFFKNVTQNWWQKWIGYLHNDLGLKFDALWIDMNEPSNLNEGVYTCPHNKYDFPEVRIKPTYARSGGKNLSHNTICMLTVQGEQNEYIHYNVHSLYGLSEIIPTQKAIHAVTGKRGFVVSRSTYVSSGRYGTHWLGDNTSAWTHLKWSIIGILEMNFFGIPFVGADICGFGGNTTPELCKRWQALGAFYPFSRNHNAIGNIDQDPAVWAERGHPEVTEAAKNSLIIRYLFLPYFYTLFFKAHTLGHTVARPLFHEFPTDRNTFNIDEQFMLGPSLLVSPFLYENQTQVKAYFPDDIWYDAVSSVKIQKPGYASLPDNKYGVPPLHARGGTVIPMSTKSGVNTEAIRRGGIKLVVIPGKDKSASGDLFWDDGESIDTIENNNYDFFSFNLNKNCSLDITVEKSGSTENQTLDTIFVLSTNGDEVEATLNGQSITSIASPSMLEFPIKINLKTKKVGEKWTLKWKSIKTNLCNIV